MFKTPLKHQLAAGELAASVAEFRDQANAGLAGRFAAVMTPEESPPDFLFAQELVGRLLERTRTSLQGSDSEQNSELLAAAVLRERRDRAVAELRILLRDARRLLDELLDPATAGNALRIRRFSNMRPEMLVQSARDVVITLRDENLGLEARPSLIFDAQALAGTLEAKASELADLLSGLATQARATQADLGAKLAEIENAADLNRRCADFLYGLYRLAGLDFHAERLRPR